MVNSSAPLIERDLKHVWHPCSQMKDFETLPPFVVREARGSYLFSDQGPLIDANSSWWCKSLGHQHPAVLEAIKKQMDQFEHVIAANTTHPVIVELAEQLADLTGLDHAFFASDGSSAVEIALKLCLHANQLRGLPQRTQFLSLKNAYHGETLATLSVSDMGIYKAPFLSFGLDCFFIDDLPYVHGRQDPLWTNAESQWLKVQKQLDGLSDNIAGLIVEPVVQGAGGILIYSPDFLRRLGQWAKEKGIYIIADEIMTGMGRTGTWLASEHADLKPDIICLSKGLTSGTVPFSCAMISHEIYDLFYDDYDKGKSFLHSHTYSGHALGAAAALATIQTFKQEGILEHVKALEGWMHEAFQDMADASHAIENIRCLGGVVAGDLMASPIERAGYQVYQQALSQGAFLRPLGNTIYWMPPLNSDETLIRKLGKITLNSIKETFKK